MPPNNGQLPDSALAPIAQGRLTKQAAAAFNAMNVQSRKMGLELLPTGSMSSYRTLAQQQLLYANYLRGGNLAAKPGTSAHGWGLAVDLATPQMWAIVARIGAQYGWQKQWSDAPSEPWHHRYQAGHYSGPDPGPHGKARRKGSSLSIAMYDSVDVDQFPPNPPAVAGYVDGRYANYKQLVAKYPKAKHLSIAVTSATDADALDVEPGDATNLTAPGWVKRQHARGVKRPVVYTSASNVKALEDALTASGIGHGSYLIWSAHYTFKAHICGPGVCGFPQADATQWTDKSQGKNLDESLCSDAFFATSPKPPAKPDTGDAHAAVTCHLGRRTGVWEVKGTAGPAHFGGKDVWEEATIGVNLKTGRWRIRRKTS